jgi:uncharacterized protein YbjT (DUF2867 family)
MSLVLVTGGTGHLGRDVVRLLKDQQHQVRILARQPGREPSVDWVGGDLATGEGVEDALSGVQTVVHAATSSPAAQRGRFRVGDFFRSPPDVDIDGTRRLLAEARRVGVEHFVHVSIVGVRQARVPYSRVKAAAEDLVRTSGVAYSIVPATGFYWLLARFLDNLAPRRIWPLPSNLVLAPVDSADFAEYLVECVTDGPHGVREGFGGPEDLTMVDIARQYRRARGAQRRIVPLRLPSAAIRALGPQTCPGGRKGRTRWSKWLDEHQTTD